MANAINQLAKRMWEEGGFRFRHVDTHWQYRTYFYSCSQDEATCSKSKAQGKRDAPRITRFQCQSDLVFRLSFGDRTLTVTLRHSYHTPYEDLRISPAVLEFIQSRTAVSTAAEIYRDLPSARPSGWKVATAAQVYYHWQQANSKMWRHHKDPMESAKLLLSEYEGYTSHVYSEANVRATAIYVSKTISALATRTKEMAIDATYGTNKAGMSLFAVLAELDGTGIPLCYCFVEVLKDQNGKCQASPGATTSVLALVLLKLRDFKFSPTFFGTDKDFSEIGAIRQVWPSKTTIQLCYWHFRRALRTKFASSRQCDTQREYKPGDAKNLIPDLEICWGSIGTNRPNGDHQYGRCDCPSRWDNVVLKGRIETACGDEQNTVLEMMSRHYNSHPLIPNLRGTYQSSTDIHKFCATEMYFWCKSRGYFRLWAYLWVNWYQPSQWCLWARSVNDQEIPVLKTTMIVESHWRRIKHDYLHRFNRPRIDLVVWVLISRFVPTLVTKMRNLLKSNHRQASASWRKDFKDSWDDLIERGTEPDRIRHYHTDPVRWTCGCPYFLGSRFLVCKHLLYCFELITDRVEFFRCIQRRRSFPFWTHEQLVLRPQYRPSEAEAIIDTESGDADDIDADDIDSDDDDIDGPGVYRDELVDLQADDELDDEEADTCGFYLRSGADIYFQQRAKGNVKFVKKVMESQASGTSIVTMAKEARKRKNRRTMPPTWGNYQHPASMYLDVDDDDVDDDDE